MKKFCVLLVLCSVICVMSSACSAKQKQPLIQSKRRFAEFVEPQQANDGTRIDLSEGPKLRYDANFGPNSPNFDIKINFLRKSKILKRYFIMIMIPI